MGQLQPKPPAPKFDYWRDEVSAVVLEPDLWLRAPHEALGGREPSELLNSGLENDEQRVQDLLDSLKHGLFS